MEGFLEQLNLDKDKPMAYDPHSVISKRRIENKNSSYEPTPTSYLEKIANKDNWEEVENILKEETKSSELE